MHSLSTRCIIPCCSGCVPMFCCAVFLSTDCLAFVCTESRIALAQFISCSFACFRNNSRELIFPLRIIVTSRISQPILIAHSLTPTDSFTCSFNRCICDAICYNTDFPINRIVECADFNAELDLKIVGDYN